MYKKALQVVYLSAIWGIWKARNKAVFNNVQAQLQKTMSDIKALSIIIRKGE
ncbi:hypothetical protein HanRHA438_Chr12g0538401 [Helianthus annuus]|nr:hypothetical protein HanRHA438_Chr12g0538401 [Helianthus annuus]